MFISFHAAAELLPFWSWGSGWAVESDNHPFIQLFSVCRAIHFFYSLYYFGPFWGAKLSESRHYFAYLYHFFHFSPLYHGRQFASPRSEPIVSSNKTPKVVRWHMVQISFLTQSQTLKANNSFYYHDNHFFLTSLTKEFLLYDMRNMGKGCQTCLKV